MKKMKKFIAIILSVLVISAAFTACSSKSDGKKSSTSASTTVTDSNKTTTDSAKITGSDAVDYIKSYSAKDLDLTKKEKKECKFMTNNSGVKIGKNYYIGVIAVYEVSETGDDGKTYIKFDHRGEYYIRYDAQQVLRRNIKEENPKEEYTELKLKAFTPESSTQAQSETKSKETTKAKE